MKLTNRTRTSHRRTRVFAPIGGAAFTRHRLSRHRLARAWPEAGERMVTAADLRGFDLQL